MNKDIKAQAQFIANKLNDSDAIWFHYKAIKKLGFQKCFELSSFVLIQKREGKLFKSIASYYNGCIKKEISNLKKL